MKKNILKSIFATLIIASIPITAFAVDPGDPVTPLTDNTNTSPIQATVGDSYTLNIPQLYNFNTIYKTANQYYLYADGTLSLTDVVLASGKKINVTVGGNGPDLTPQNYTLSDSASPTPNTITFAMCKSSTADGSRSDSDVLSDGDKIIDGATAATSDDVHCYASLDANTLPAAGDYTGSIRFSATVS